MIIVNVPQQRAVVRKVVHVGQAAPVSYQVAVDMPELLLVDVDPKVLNFAWSGQQLNYTVRVAARPKFTLVQGAVFQGSVTWSSDQGHVVPSPMLAVVVVTGLPAPQPSTPWELLD